jgi:hypothetical protein
MSTMMLICPIQMLKLLVGFELEVLIRYVLKEGSGITGNFPLEHIVPSIPVQFSDPVATVLALVPLLCAVFENDNNYLQQVSQFPDDEYPVKKLEY